MATDERRILAALAGQPNPTAEVEEAGRYFESECAHIAPDHASLGLRASLTPPPRSHSDRDPRRFERSVESRDVARCSGRMAPTVGVRTTLSE